MTNDGDAAMAFKNRFLVSYILNNQPKSTEIETEMESLLPEQTRSYLEALHATRGSDSLTDIQVTGLHHPKNRAGSPAHYRQAEGTMGNKMT